MSPEIMLMRIIDRAQYWDKKSQVEDFAGRKHNANDFFQRSKALWSLYDSLSDEIRQEVQSHGTSTSNN